MSSNKKNTLQHNPVLLDEVIASLNPQKNEVFVDCTFGAGGYTSAILNSAECSVYGIDRDPLAQKFAEPLTKQFPGRFHLFQGVFGDIESMLNHAGVESVDGIVLDLGVSSMQLDEGERGFSFQQEAKLDMRMGQNELSAYDVVNKTPEKDLADIIYNYGDEVKSRHIAKKIAELRKIKPIETTTELANIVRSFYPAHKKQKIDPATKTFQAIRIYVNKELDQLRKALEASKKLLKKGGRLVVVTFHSLEDKIVKDFFKKESGYENRKVDKYKQVVDSGETTVFTLMTKKPITPTEEELKNNIRARSAKLRYVIKN